MKNKYKIYTDKKNRKVIAATRYAGRVIKATATCSPEDTFDIEFGSALAIARCKQKVAKVKIQNASVKYLEAAAAADMAQKRYDDMKQYYMDSVDQFDEAVAETAELIKKISN